MASGPEHAYDLALPYLEALGRKVTYVGSGDEARLVKICHNLMLGAVSQSMAEITMLAEAGGVYVSGAVHDRVKGKLPLKYDFLG